MKRLTISLIAALAATSVCLTPGCGGDREGETPRDVRLTFWHIQTSTKTGDVISDAVGRFEEKEETVAVKVSPYKNDPFKDEIDRGMATGVLPDVFHTWGGGVLKEYVDQGRVLDLTAFISADNDMKRVHPAALRFATYDGKTYAVPMDVSAVLMWYNRDLFKKHNVSIPRTFAELKAACRKLRSAGVTPIALGNANKWPGAFYFTYLAARVGGKRPFADAAARAPGGTFAHPSFIRAGHLVQELVAAGAFNSSINSATYDNARALFVQEKAAMMLMGTWLMADVRSDLADAADTGLLQKIDFFEFPTVAGGIGDAHVVVGGTNSAYAISASCRTPDKAFALIKEFVSDLTAHAWAETGRIPALREDVVMPMLDETTLKAAKVLFGAPDVQLYYDQYLPKRLSEAHKNTTRSLFAGTMTPEQAAATMENVATNPNARTQ